MQPQTQPVFASEADVTAYIHSPSFQLEGLKIVGQPIIIKMVFHPLTLRNEPMCSVELAGTFISVPFPSLPHQPMREEPLSCNLQVILDCQTGTVRGWQPVTEQPESGPPAFTTEEDVRTVLSSGPFGTHRIRGVGVPTIESIEMRGGQARVVLSGLFWFAAPRFVEHRPTVPIQCRVGVVFDCQTGWPIEWGYLSNPLESEGATNRGKHS